MARTPPRLEVHYMQYVNPLWRSRKLTTILSKWRSSDKLAINKDRPWDFLTNIGTTIFLAIRSCFRSRNTVGMDYIDQHHHFTVYAALSTLEAYEDDQDGKSICGCARIPR